VKGPWIAMAAGALVAIAAPPGSGAQGGEVRRVPLTSLATASVRITFEGTIKLTGTTKTLTYTQPLPAEDEGQDIASVEVGPSPGLAHELVEDGEGRTVRLTWTDPPAGEVRYSITVAVERRAFDRPVTSPDKGQAKAFLKSGTLTQPSAEIKKQAKELADGSPSDLATVLAIAHWIHENVEYDKNYSQTKQDKKVTQVMQVMRGTCDELSHLFIAMARSVSIPAREVSGLAFTGESWGFHSWSEVRLGDRWVPVDATNLQVGFVDATHVAFARDNDDAKFQQSIESLGTGMFSVVDHGMDVRIMKAATAADMLKATLSFEPPSVPPGLPVKARLVLDNPSNSWFAGPARLVVPEGFKVSGDPIGTYVLGPGGHEVIEWDIGTPAKLTTGATYWYRMGAVMFPHLVADSKLTIAAGLIGEVAAFQDAGGNAVVALGVHNPLPDAGTASIEVCLTGGWDLEGEPMCYASEEQLEPSASAKVEFQTEFAITSDFAIEVRIDMAGLTDERVHKVNISQAN
jgi:hypothetical protein